MVGNDVVDLCDPDSDSTRYRSRFDARVFRKTERESIAYARYPERQRWRLWAAKEASYKLARQQDCAIWFSPRAFTVACDRSSSCGRVKVSHEKLSCFVEFDETPQRIHAIAVPSLEDFAFVLLGIERIAMNSGLDAAALSVRESKAVRDLACDAISRRFAYSREELKIRRTEHRIPRLYRRDHRLDLSISLSHQGSWLAFACSREHCTGENRSA